MDIEAYNPVEISEALAEMQFSTIADFNTAHIGVFWSEALSGGSFIVVPKGHWHRHNMLQRSKELYLSPAATEHSADNDPW